MHRTVSGLFRLLGAVLAVAVVLAGLLAWRLSQGPIQLDFARPYIEQALSSPQLAVRLRSTELSWSGAARSVELRAIAVEAVAGGEVLAVVPELALSLSGRALVSGRLRPRSIALFQPRLRLVREVDGSLRFSIGAPTALARGDLAELLDHLATDRSGPLANLRRLELVDGDLTIEDRRLGLTWRVPDADILLRRAGGGIEANAALALDLAGVPAQVVVEAGYAADEALLRAHATFSGIVPARLSAAAAALAPLAALELPLSGTAEATYALRDGLRHLRLDLAGGEGRLALPAPVATSYPVVALQARLEVTADLALIRLDELHVDLGGPTVTASAVAAREGAGWRLMAEGAAARVPVDSLSTLWPPGLGEDAREWVMENLSRGMASSAHITLSAHTGAAIDDLVIDRLDGEISGEGVTVHYLGQLPPVRNASALCRFDQDSFRIEVGGGQVHGLKVSGGTIAFDRLSTKRPNAVIDLRVDGPLPDVLRLIDQKPLGYATVLGLKPTRAKGQSTTRLSLAFPLTKRLKLEDVAVKADARLTGVVLPEALMGLNLTQGELDLTVDAKGMDVVGTALLGTIPTQLAWRENFTPGPVRSRYQLRGSLDDAQRAELSLAGAPLLPPFVSGPVGAEIEVVSDGKGGRQLGAQLDFAAAAMVVPALSWRKPAGQPARGEVALSLRQERVAAVPAFLVSGPDGFLVKGSAAFDAEGKARRVNFERLRAGRNDLRGMMSIGRDDALDLSVSGVFDAAPLLSPGGGAGTKAGGRDDDGPPFAVTALLERLWIGQRAGFDHVSVSLRRDRTGLRALRAEAGLPEGKSVRLDVVPVGPRRRFELSSDDAGGVFRAAQVFDSMIGGALRIAGSFEDDRPGAPVSGVIDVANYQIVNAPALARLLTVAALTGIVDLLRGSGISFSKLDVPFVYRDGVLQLGESAAYGPSLGLTGKGAIDLARERIELEGTIVPAYLLNSILGNLPLIGTLLTGERGSGIFAATYWVNGPLAEPTMTVNPLAVLTPGILRKIFGIFSGAPPEAAPLLGDR